MVLGSTRCELRARSYLCNTCTNKCISKVNNEKAYEKNGAYFIDDEIVDGVVNITFDEYSGQGEVITKSEAWPAFN